MTHVRWRDTRILGSRFCWLAGESLHGSTWYTRIQCRNSEEGTLRAPPHFTSPQPRRAKGRDDALSLPGELVTNPSAPHYIPLRSVRLARTKPQPTPETSYKLRNLRRLANLRCRLSNTLSSCQCHGPRDWLKQDGAIRHECSIGPRSPEWKRQRK